LKNTPAGKTFTIRELGIDVTIGREIFLCLRKPDRETFKEKKPQQSTLNQRVTWLAQKICVS